MKGRILAAMASYIAAICFFTAYLFRQHGALMLLGAVWLCIGSIHLLKIYRNRK